MTGTNHVVNGIDVQKLEQITNELDIRRFHHIKYTGVVFADDKDQIVVYANSRESNELEKFIHLRADELGRFYHPDKKQQLIGYKPSLMQADLRVEIRPINSNIGGLDDLVNIVGNDVLINNNGSKLGYSVVDVADFEKTFGDINFDNVDLSIPVNSLGYLIKRNKGEIKSTFEGIGKKVINKAIEINGSQMCSDSRAIIETYVMPDEFVFNNQEISAGTVSVLEYGDETKFNTYWHFNHFGCGMGGVVETILQNPGAEPILEEMAKTRVIGASGAYNAFIQSARENVDVSIIAPMDYDNRVLGFRGFVLNKDVGGERISAMIDLGRAHFNGSKSEKNEDITEGSHFFKIFDPKTGYKWHARRDHKKKSVELSDEQVIHLERFMDQYVEMNQKFKEEIVPMLESNARLRYYAEEKNINLKIAPKSKGQMATKKGQNPAFIYVERPGHANQFKKLIGPIDPHTDIGLGFGITVADPYSDMKKSDPSLASQYYAISHYNGAKNENDGFGATRTLFIRGESEQTVAKLMAYHFESINGKQMGKFIDNGGQVYGLVVPESGTDITKIIAQKDMGTNYTSMLEKQNKKLEK
ncbi:hypothetical protein HOD20_03655 [archaeon]|jgi:hypothetical protein|nr:hypothetical protein [archaeon]MBT4648354.1 hypothetical protein [archaeon]MBT6822343.1 hypothetical protein [archaeon]